MFSNSLNSTEWTKFVSKVMVLTKKQLIQIVGKHYAARRAQKVVKEAAFSPETIGMMLTLLNSSVAQGENWQQLRSKFISCNQECIDRLSAIGDQPKRPRIKVNDSLAIILIFGVLCRLTMIPELTVEDQFLFLTRCFKLGYKDSTVRRILTGINTSNPIIDDMVEAIKRVKGISMEDIVFL